MNQSAQDVEQLMKELAELMSGLPEPGLDAGDRMQLAGHLFLGHEEVILRVAEALRDEMAAFPQARARPEGLLGQLLRSEALLALHEHLQILATRAWDLYLLDRAQAVKEAMREVRQVRAEQQMPYPPVGARGRAEAMVAVEEVLTGRHRRGPGKRSGAQKGKGRGRIKDRNTGAGLRAEADRLRPGGEQEERRGEDREPPGPGPEVLGPVDGPRP